MRPKVSIVMPVFNGGEYFRLALESAIGQNYENTEIIVVNDGSTDYGETESIALEYGSLITYVRQKNKGVAGALNTAIQHARGDYFTWLSHDDIHLPIKIERQVDFMSNIGRPDVILFSDYELIDSDGKLLATGRKPHREFVEHPMLPLMRGGINGCTLFVPMAIMRAYGPFNETLRYTQDYELWNKILADYDFFHQPEVLVQYRIHAAQDTNKPAAVIEGDDLWIRLMQSRTAAEQVQLSGSRRKFYSSMAAFLQATPYKKAEAFARENIPRVMASTLVSIIVPFYNEIELTCRAVHSALKQTHPLVEVLLIDDGSTENIDELESLAAKDSRLRIFRQLNAGPGAARNLGLREATGEYIAFLDADDLFLPHKIARQLQLMQQGGYRISHTSYYVSYPEQRGEELGILHSGIASGRLYPNIISGCGIAMPTVMVHRLVLADGFEFPTASHVAEDILAWIDLSMRYDVLGIDEPLSIVEWSSTSAALNYDSQILGAMFILASISGSPTHCRELGQIGKIKSWLKQAVQVHKSGSKDMVRELVDVAFGGTD